MTDLKNESTTMEKLNMSQKEIWEEVAYIDPETPFALSKCVTIHLPKNLENQLPSVIILSFLEIRSHPHCKHFDGQKHRFYLCPFSHCNFTALLWLVEIGLYVIPL